MRLLKLSLFFSGAILALVAITAGRLGIGDPEQFGAGRVLAVVVGAGLLLLSVLIRESHFVALASAIKSIAGPYLKVGAILLTGLLLVGFVDGVCFAINHVTDTTDPRARLSYYRGQAWSATYWREHAQAFTRKRYNPFVVWRTAPFQGETINIDANGIRKTPGSVDSASSYRVFVFGGSTILGFGSPDWGTIPAYLLEDLKPNFPAVSVTNFGELGWVSTQSVILLIRQLQSGKVPNLVIFYDGANEALSAIDDGHAGDHAGRQRIAMQLEHPMAGALLDSSLAKFLLPRIEGIERRSRRMVPDDRLAKDVVDTYLSNYRTVEALASQYGFKFRFFLQPIILTSRKPLTAEERRMIPEMEYTAPGVPDLITKVYKMVGADAPRLKNLRLLNGVFDAREPQLWVDWCHVTPEGNKIVADAIVDALRP